METFIVNHVVSLQFSPDKIFVVTITALFVLSALRDLALIFIF